MQLKIRVKVKHLVMVGAAMILLLSAGYYALPQANAWRSGEVSTAAGERDKAALLAKLAASEESEKKWKLIQTYVLSDGMDSLAHGYQVFAGSNFTMSGGVSDGVDRPFLTWEEKLPSLLAYLEKGPAGMVGYRNYLLVAAKQLALYYSSMGETDKAVHSLEIAEGRLENGQPVKQLRLERAKLLVREGKYAQAEALLKDLRDNDGTSIDLDMDANIAALQAQILIKQHSLNEALTSVRQEIDTFNESYRKITDSKQDGRNDKPLQLEQLYVLQRLLQERPSTSSGGSSSVVSGTVLRSDGAPMAHVGVFLRTRDAVNHSVMETEPYQTMTDDQGRYSFPDVLQGTYQLMLGFQYEQIDGWIWPVNNDEWMDIIPGKNVTVPVLLRPLMNLVSPVNNVQLTGQHITFRWEPVDGAAYYKLSGSIDIGSGGSIGVEIQHHIEGHEWSAPVDSLYNLQAGYSYTEVNGKQVPDPVSLLGFANPGKRFSWSVEAYDQGGQKLTQSNGYRLTKNTIGNLPFFKLKARTLSEGDRLLLAFRSEEALAAYKRAWEADHADVYSLGMIIRLYNLQKSDEKEIVSSDALPYVLRMMELKPESQYCFWLMYHYIATREWTNAQTYYERGLQLGKDDDLTYIQSTYAAALMEQGKYNQAREMLAEVMPKDNSHRFVGHYLAADLYVTGSISHAEALAKQYPERNFGGAESDWSKLLHAMSEEAAGSANYIQQLKQVLDWQYRHQTDQLKQWKSESTQGALKAFLDELSKID